MPSLLFLIALLFGGWNHGTTAGSCWTPGSDGWMIECSTPSNGGTCGASGNNTGTCFIAVDNIAGTSGCAAHTTSAAAQADACDTINHGIAQLRSGQSADWLMLKRGDTFVNQDFNGSGGTTAGTFLCGQHGVDSTHPLVITNYGSGARPIIEPNPASSATLANVAWGSYGGGGCAGGGTIIAVIGIEIYSLTLDPNGGSYTGVAAGMELLNPVTWMLFEDDEFLFFGLDIDGGGNTVANSGMVFRRNEFLDVFSPVGGRVQGLYLNEASGSTLYENIFDHNGWNATASGGGATIFNHNAYLNYCGVVTGDSVVSSCIAGQTLTGNIFARDASGIQNRMGGTQNSNAFILSPYGTNIFQPLNIASAMNYNLHIEGMDNTVNGGTVTTFPTIGASSVDGIDGVSFAMNLGSVAYDHNVIAHSLTPASNDFGLTLDPLTRNQTLTNNVSCDWLGGTYTDNSIGDILTYGSVTPGSGYTNNSYTNVTMQYVTSGAGTGAFTNITVSGGAVASVAAGNLNTGGRLSPGGTGYSVNDSLTNSSSLGAGSGFHVPVASVYAGNSINGTNYSLAADCNHNVAFTDPNRTPGSYFATLAGSTANATFTGVIASGVLTISGITGTVAAGDAITWSGQTAQDFIKSFGSGTGGNGTYNLAGTETVGSGAMSSYTTVQFINAARANNKANWNGALTATALNTYILAGFGITNPFTP